MFWEAQLSPFHCLMMASIILYSVYAITVIVSTVSGQEGGTCQPCNCQFNNVEVLNQLIKSNIAAGKLHSYFCMATNICINNTCMWENNASLSKQVSCVNFIYGCSVLALILIVLMQHWATRMVLVLDSHNPKVFRFSTLVSHVTLPHPLDWNPTLNFQSTAV